MLRIPRILTIATAIVCTNAAHASAQSASVDDQLHAAYVAAYNLDHDVATERLESLVELAPELPTSHRALASITWLRLLFSRGTVLVDEYLGKVSQRDVQRGPPPAETAATFQRHLRAALELSERQVQERPSDPRALYELASALGLQASYAATVEGRMGRAFGSARRAYRTAGRALALAPEAPEPRLILGTYRYVVAGLKLPSRMVAYMAGMDGDRERGLQLVEQAADAASSHVQTEARFALVLLYNREKRWDDALQVLSRLRAAYPRNRLLWLETGATALRAGRPQDAERWLTAGIDMAARDTRRRMFGEQALWHLKRAQARRQVGRTTEAREDLLAGLFATDARDWVRGRTHLEFAELSLATGDTDQARWQAEKAVPLLQRGHDPEGVRAARQLLERLSRG